LAKAIRHPNWIACTSIGAVDGALIAGNAND
jgi:predicted acylesterase/phospholipase RssA